MMSQEVFVPIYFAHWSPELQIILDDVSNSLVMDEKAGTAAQGKEVWVRIIKKLLGIGKQTDNDIFFFVDLPFTTLAIFEYACMKFCCRKRGIEHFYTIKFFYDVFTTPGVVYL